MILLSTADSIGLRALQRSETIGDHLPRRATPLITTGGVFCADRVAAKRRPDIFTRLGQFPRLFYACAAS